MRPEDVLKLYETRIKLQHFDELAPLRDDDTASCIYIFPKLGSKYHHIRLVTRCTSMTMHTEVQWN
jgi:hypothetical protein